MSKKYSKVVYLASRYTDPDPTTIGYQLAFLKHEFRLLLQYLNLEIEEYEEPNIYYDVSKHRAWRIKMKGEEISEIETETTTDMNDISQPTQGNLKNN